MTYLVWTGDLYGNDYEITRTGARRPRWVDLHRKAKGEMHHVHWRWSGTSDYRDRPGVNIPALIITCRQDWLSWQA
jgi:hypothetical protein